MDRAKVWATGTVTTRKDESEVRTDNKDGNGEAGEGGHYFVDVFIYCQASAAFASSEPVSYQLSKHPSPRSVLKSLE